MTAPTILLVDDDPGTRETMGVGLPHFGIHVVTATNAQDAVAIATQRRFDCLLVDQRLPDMAGTDLVRTIRSRGVDTPFAMMSGYLAVGVVVDAMRLGAHEVLEKPIDIEQLAALLVEIVGTTAASGIRANSVSRSVADRWADHAEKACECSSDPKTLAYWARAAGVSYSSLCETCRLLSIRPHAARDFVRVLRVLIHAPQLQCPPEALLDVSDRRTVAALLHSAGVEHKSQFGMYSVSMFLERQTFIDRQNQALRRLSVRLEPALTARGTTRHR